MPNAIAIYSNKNGHYESSIRELLSVYNSESSVIEYDQH